ncbi:MAG: zinc ribbon domain-containing protein [Firmicutes bacterium]|nr:zinc ribbon domain-containing protein [Bacillota bacterium]
MNEKFKDCPRCGKKILIDKTICSFCGSVVKEKQIEKDVIAGDRKGDPCPICARPPEGTTFCPNCGLKGICSHHLYTFFSDKKNSPKGCLKCGPRCAICGVQTTLMSVKGRAVCSTCSERLGSSGFLHKEQQRKTAEVMKAVITTLFTIIGLGMGIYLGMKPEIQKMILVAIKQPKFNKMIITVVSSFTGLIAGSLLASIINSFIKEPE